MPVRYTVILTDEVKAGLHALPLALRREYRPQAFPAGGMANSRWLDK